MDKAYLEDNYGAIEFLLSIDQFIFGIDAERREGAHRAAISRTTRCAICRAMYPAPELR
jgi:hypothetical protein